MPETRHRLCIWHITKKIPEKFKRHKRYEELQSDLNNIVWESISEDDFQNQWEDFLIEYGLEDNKWLSGTSLNMNFYILHIGISILVFKKYQVAIIFYLLEF